MSITKELRDYMLSNSPADYDAFSTIVGRIDEEHEREVTMACGKAVAELGSKVAREYVKLPVDTDGNPIRLGDDMYYVNDRSHHGPVEVMTLTNDGWKVERDEPSHLRHWDRSTVEELLLDFSDKVLDSNQWGLDAEDTIGDYAERILKAVNNEQQ